MTRDQMLRVQMTREHWARDQVTRVQMVMLPRSKMAMWPVKTDRHGVMWS
jgi:hypothetical protein